MKAREVIDDALSHSGIDDYDFISAAILSALSAAGYKVVPVEVTDREIAAIAHAIDYTILDDGDPLGVALAENFRIEEGCNSAAELRASLNKVLFEAARRARRAMVEASE